MTEIAAPTPEDDIIEHQERVEAVVVEEGDQHFARRSSTTIAAPSAPGATYNQTEMASLKTAIDAIRAVLTATHVSG